MRKIFSEYCGLNLIRWYPKYTKLRRQIKKEREREWEILKSHIKGFLHYVYRKNINRFTRRVKLKQVLAHISYKIDSISNNDGRKKSFRFSTLELVENFARTFFHAPTHNFSCTLSVRYLRSVPVTRLNYSAELFMKFRNEEIKNIKFARGLSHGSVCVCKRARESLVHIKFIARVYARGKVMPRIY